MNTVPIFRLTRRRLLVAAPAAIGLASCSRLPPVSKSKPVYESKGLIDARIMALGIVLPKPPAAVATYAPYRIIGQTVYIAGQGPALSPSGMQGAKVQGTLGKDMSIEEGVYAARSACLNLIAQAKAACGGDLDRIVQWVKMGGFINSADGFTDQPKVLNGATDLLREIFGDKGVPARFAVGVNTLPFNVSVEVDAVLEIKA